MPEYSQIQTYIKCKQDMFRHVVNEFVVAISPLGFYEPQIVEDLSQLEWKVEDDGSTSIGGVATAQLLSIGDVKLNVRPLLMGWTSDSCYCMEPLGKQRIRGLYDAQIDTRFDPIHEGSRQSEHFGFHLEGL